MNGHNTARRRRTQPRSYFVFGTHRGFREPYPCLGPYLDEHTARTHPRVSSPVPGWPLTAARNSRLEGGHWSVALCSEVFSYLSQVLYKKQYR